MHFQTIAAHPDYPKLDADLNIRGTAIATPKNYGFSNGEVSILVPADSTTDLVDVIAMTL